MSELTASTSSCPICHGSGWVLMVENGGNTVAKRCKCYSIERVKRINEKSGFPPSEYHRMTLDNFKTETEEQKKMLEIAKSFVENPGQGVGFFGKSGTGKTHICIGICQELTKRYGHVHRYFSYRKEMHNLAANYFSEQICNEKLDEWGMADVLYVDDLFKFTTNRDGESNQRELQLFYELLNLRTLNKKITIFSSEHSLKDITTIDEAIGSRIYEMIYPYAMRCEGANYRLGGKR